MEAVFVGEDPQDGFQEETSHGSDDQGAIEVGVLNHPGRFKRKTFLNFIYAIIRYSYQCNLGVLSFT